MFIINFHITLLHTLCSFETRFGWEQTTTTTTREIMRGQKCHWLLKKVIVEYLQKPSHNSCFLSLSPRKTLTLHSVINFVYNFPLPSSFARQLSPPPVNFLHKVVIINSNSRDDVEKNQGVISEKRIKYRWKCFKTLFHVYYEGLNCLPASFVEQKKFECKRRASAPNKKRKRCLAN